MLIFDEKKYAERLLKAKHFQTYRQKDIERYVLIRYLSNKGMNLDEIRKKIESNFPLVGREYLEEKEIDFIYDKIYEKALSRPLITDIKINIFEEEMKFIDSVKNTNARNLLFVLLVYYKWATEQPYSGLYFFSRYNNANMVMINDIDIWKCANLMKLRVKERYELSSELIREKLYIEDNFKSSNYYYLPFIKDESNGGKVVMTIDNYDNILGELEIYDKPDEYKRCSECGAVFKKTRSPKKYCNYCAKNIKNENNKKYYQKTNLGKTQMAEMPIK